MASSKIYTRAYSKNSSRQLVSAKAPKDGPLSDIALREEFRNHANLWSLEPTAFVSVSDRIVDTLSRAFDKYLGDSYRDGESAADIWIAFIEVAPTMDKDTTRIHSAKKLAEKCNLPEPNKFLHEVVFEWAIPKKCIVHEVSLQTLMERGLQKHYFLRPSTREVRSTEEVRYYIAKELQRYSPWAMGITLDVFAQKFGARAPLDWISHQLFRDCVSGRILNIDVVRLYYAHKYSEIVDFQFFFELDDGIHTALHHWWLSDIDFVHEEFREWRDITEESMTQNLIDFWET